MKKFNVDHSEETYTIEDLKENELSTEELSLIESLKVGESQYVGMCEIERTK